jgi:hypothetical protein
VCSCLFLLFVAVRGADSRFPALPGRSAVDFPADARCPAPAGEHPAPPRVLTRVCVFPGRDNRPLPFGRFAPKFPATSAPRREFAEPSSAARREFAGPSGAARRTAARPKKCLASRPTSKLERTQIGNERHSQSEAIDWCHEQGSDNTDHVGWEEGWERWRVTNKNRGLLFYAYTFVVNCTILRSGNSPKFPSVFFVPRAKPSGLQKTSEGNFSRISS